MGKQSKSRKAESFGKGKVTPVQLAFIVDRYLSDNNFSQTRSTFRTEASDLISRSPVQEAPKSLLSLMAMLDEYICLKEQKVMLDQEKCRLEHEKIRVHSLLRGMQDVMSVYNAGGSANPPPQPVIPTVPAKSAVIVSRTDLAAGSPSGGAVHNTPMMMTTYRPTNNHIDPSNFSSPVTNNANAKRRKGPKDVPDAPIAAKKSRSLLAAYQKPVIGPSTLSQSSSGVNSEENALLFPAPQATAHGNLTNRSSVQGSSVAKCLFNQPSLSPPTNLSIPKTPVRTTSSQTDKSDSPPETCSNATSINDVTHQQTTSTTRIVISSETIRVSPAKQLTYYSIERNHCASSSSPVKANLKSLTNRDHVKGRLDFDGLESSGALRNSGKPTADVISVSESDKEGEMSDLDLLDFDPLDVDLSLSELLVGFEFDGDFFGQPVMESSPSSHSGSPHEPSLNVDLGSNQFVSELPSSVTEILSEKDMNAFGPESMTSLTSTTKYIKILSPVKNHRSSSSQQEDLCAEC